MEVGLVNGTELAMLVSPEQDIRGVIYSIGGAAYNLSPVCFHPDLEEHEVRTIDNMSVLTVVGHTLVLLPPPLLLGTGSDHAAALHPTISTEMGGEAHVPLCPPSCVTNEECL